MGTWPEVGSGQGIGEECSQVENGRKIGRELGGGWAGKLSVGLHEHAW